MQSHADRRFWLIMVVTLAINISFIPFSMVFLGAEYQYTLRIVSVGGALLGIISGVIGSFAVLRQQSLVGDAVAHAALPGVVIAFLVAGRSLGWLLIGAAIAGMLGILFINALTRTTRIKQDTAMGIVLAAWFGFGVALLTYIQGQPNAGQAGINKFIFGQAAAIVQQDVILVSVVGAAIIGVLILFWKEFKLITFDYEFAAANGFRVRFFDTLLSTLIVIGIVLGLQLAGVILMVGLLIAPAVAARQWTNKIEHMVVLSGMFGALSGSVGAVISALDTGLPTGPLIIVVAFIVVNISLAFAPERGVVWTWRQQRADRRRFAAQHILSDIYRYAQSHHDFDKPVDTDFLKGLRGQYAMLGLQNLSQRGLVESVDAGWRLTTVGYSQATKLDHNALLWEAYRVHSTELDLPLVQLNKQVDIHDVLAPEAIQRLEHLLEGAH